MEKRFSLKNTNIASVLGRFLISGLMGLFLPGLVRAADLRDPGYFFDRNSGNLQQEAATARSEGKHGVLIMFEQANCPSCTTLMTTVLNQGAAQDFYRKHFRILRVDIKSTADYT